MAEKLSSNSRIPRFLNRVIIMSFLVWIGCFLAVIAVIGYVAGIRNEQFDNAPEVFTISILVFILLGCAAFLIGVFSLAIRLIVSRRREGQGVSMPSEFIKLFLVIATLPLYLWFYILKPLKTIRRFKNKGIVNTLKSVGIKSFVAKTAAFILVGVIIFPIWISGYAVAGALVTYEVNSRLGYITQDISIVGTGSMYPTWPKGTKGKNNKELYEEIISTAGFLPYPNGIVIKGKRYFGHTLGRGDIITWTNDATRELTGRDGGEPSGLLKRLIGLPGDTVELRDGIVYLNKKPQKEPYIAKPRSTFGEKFLKECQVITVPKGTVFAMGDNRKGSADSREIGFTPIQDINLVLPLSKQKGKLDKNWHDPSNDLASSNKPKIDRPKFVMLLNKLRREKGVPELKYDEELEVSARLRGEYILENDDFEQKGNYTMERSMSDAGYWNAYWWELPIQGYYEAEELIEDYLERDWTDAKDIWFDEKFDDIGIAEVSGTLNGCPTQVIVVHAAGYIPPNYKQEDIDGWKNNLSRLREIQSSWASLKDYSSFYEKNKNDVDRINEIISIRISNISTIVSKMEANQWLNSSEQNMIDQDEALYYEQEGLADKLNNSL